MKTNKEENWEKEFDERWYLWDYSKKFNIYTYTTCGNAVKEFISDLLKQQAKDIIEEILWEIEKEILIKCECEDGGCLNCQRICGLIDKFRHPNHPQTKI